MVKLFRRLVEYLALGILVGGIVIVILMAGKFREHQKQEAAKPEMKSELVTPSSPHLSEDTVR